MRLGILCHVEQFRRPATFTTIFERLAPRATPRQSYDPERSRPAGSNLTIALRINFEVKYPLKGRSLTVRRLNGACSLRDYDCSKS
jgi:hypothetical protein